MRRAIYILFLLTVTAANAVCQTDTGDAEFRQYTSWNVALGPNLTTYRIDLGNAEDAPDKVRPGLGIDCGGALDYHITRDWSLQMGLLGNIERIGLQKEEDKTTLTAFGLDLALQATWRNGKGLSVAAGPYTHFVYASATSDQSMPNPYHRGFADDPRTDEPLFAIGDLNAGLAITAACNIAGQWQIVLDFKWGVTDLLNTDSHRLYVRPFKTGLRISYSFD